MIYSPSARSPKVTSGESPLGYLPVLQTLGDRVDLGEGLGAHRDDAVASTDADGIGRPAHQRIRTRPGPLVPVTATTAALADAGHQPRKCGDHSQNQSHGSEPDSSPEPGSGLPRAPRCKRASPPSVGSG